MASGLSPITVVLATGGTIAGASPSATDNTGYRAGALGVQALIAAVPALAGLPIEAEQVAQIDSKDMNTEVWRTLVGRIEAHAARPEVSGVVVTHGTDTLEETAYLLHRVLRTPKPVVLTAAMRPATSLQADGPQNLLDAVTLARWPGAAGICVAVGGLVFAGAELRKVHGYRIDAFSAGDAGPIGTIEEGRVRCWRAPPPLAPHPGAAALLASTDWPAVYIVTSHAGAHGAGIDALCAAGARGLVIAGTGNGSVHEAIEAAAGRALAAGVVVRRASRCLLGGVIGGGPPGALPDAGVLTPMQALIELMLDLAAAKGPHA